MAKYSEKTQNKIEEVMHEYKQGKLKTKGGRVVKKRDQAIAVGLSEARSAGGNVPEPKK